MKTLLFRTFLPLLILSCSLAQAQDRDGVAAPTAPYVPALSGNFTMVKTITYLPPNPPLTPIQKVADDLANPPATKPAVIRAVESGTLRKDSERFLDGSSRNIWRVQNYRLSNYSATPQGVIVDMVSSPNADAAAPSHYRDAADFPELDWIQGPAYQGIQMQQGKKCYTYKSGEQTAWIDATTRRPVYFKSKEMEVTYAFSDGPDEPLHLPPGYAEKLDKFKRVLRGQL